VLVPDLVFFTAARFAEVVNEKHATAAPDRVVEMLSPGTRRRDLGRKRAVYDRDGAREYWIVDPDARSITVLRRPRSDAGLTDVTVHALASGDVLESPDTPPARRLPLRPRPGVCPKLIRRSAALPTRRDGARGLPWPERSRRQPA